MMLAETNFCGRCKYNNKCKSSDKYSYVSHIKNLLCFTPCDTTIHDEVSGIDLYVYSNGTAIINDCYDAERVGLPQEYMPHEKLKEIVRNRVKEYMEWTFRS